MFKLMGKKIYTFYADNFRLSKPENLLSLPYLLYSVYAGSEVSGEPLLLVHGIYPEISCAGLYVVLCGDTA